jgi:hypothetical protein
MNPLYQQYLMQNMPGNNALNLLQQYMQFKTNFKGNAREQIEAMMKNGQITQQQYDSAVAQAQQLQQIFSK